jgi:hypothetical protein
MRSNRSPGKCGLPALRDIRKERNWQALVLVVMRPTAKYVAPREVLTHFLNGAGLGVFLGIALIVANSTVLNMMVHAPYPKVGVLTFVLAVAGLIAVGSAISGFIMTAVDKAKSQDRAGHGD